MSDSIGALTLAGLMKYESMLLGFTFPSSLKKIIDQCLTNLDDWFFFSDKLIVSRYKQLLNRYLNWYNLGECSWKK
jgi:hypothetical protein